MFRMICSQKITKYVQIGCLAFLLLYILVPSVKAQESTSQKAYSDLYNFFFNYYGGNTGGCYDCWNASYCFYWNPDADPWNPDGNTGAFQLCKLKDCGSDYESVYI